MRRPAATLTRTRKELSFSIRYSSTITWPSDPRTHTHQPSDPWSLRAMQGCTQRSGDPPYVLVGV
eukprot:4834920-Pyramimonas_sp.AAC.1